MKISRINIYRLLVLVIAAMYCLIVFLAVKEYNENFWILFAFTIVIFLAALVSTFLKGDGRKHLAERMYFMNIPLFYLVMQSLLHFLLLIPSLNFIITLLIEIFFFLAVIAFTLFKLAHTSVISENVATQRKQVQYLSMLEACLTACEEDTSDANVKNEIHKLIKKIRYSDYNSRDEVSGIENEMVSLTASLTGQDPEEQLQTIKRLNVLLTQRNNMILMLK